MAKIQEIKDNQNVLVYPVTHERAVWDTGGNKLSDKLNNLSIFTYTNVELAQEMTGYRIESDGTITGGSYTTVEVYKYAVTGGKKYAFSGKMTATFTLYFLFWYDANMNFISREPYKGSSSVVSYTRQQVTAPANAAFAMMNVNVSQKSYYKLEELVQIPTQDFYDDAVLKENIVDSLDSTATDQPLSANEGRVLKEYIDSKPSGDQPAMTYKELPIYATYEDTGIFGPNDYRTSTSWIVKKYEVVAGNDYYLCGYMPGTYDLYFLYWYDSEDNYVSRAPYKGTSSSSNVFISFQKVTAPEGAAYARVNIRSSYSKHTALYDGTIVTNQADHDLQEKVNTLLGVKAGTIQPMSLYMNSSGKFEDHWVYRHAAIKVSPGEKYTIKNDGVGTALRYAFATTDVATVNTAVPVVTGTTVHSIPTAGTTVTIPEGCSYLLVNYVDYNLEGQATFDVTKVIEGESPSPTPTSEKRKLRLVCIGNSYSQDALAYVPFIMQAMGIDVDVTIGILMMSSSTLSDHIENFEGETAAYTYYHYESGATAWENQGKKTIQYALETYQWDIILTHSVGAGETNKNVYMPKVHRIVNDLYTDLAYPVKLGWVSGQTRPAVTNGGANRTDEVIMNYYNILQGQSQNILQESVFDFNIPVGTAVQNARTIPALKAIGEYASNENNTSGNGYLCYSDGVHLQEGLPCQLAAYTVILTLLDLLGINEKSIFGDPTRVISSWTSDKSIPSPHGTCTGSTDDNCRMAQQCAIMAHKHPFEVTDMTDIVNTNYE